MLAPNARRRAHLSASTVVLNLTILILAFITPNVFASSNAGRSRARSSRTQSDNSDDELKRAGLRPLQWKSPLRCLTVFDKSPVGEGGEDLSASTLTPRQRFEVGFRAGVAEEKAERAAIEREQRQTGSLLGEGEDAAYLEDTTEDFFQGSKWAEKTAEREEIEFGEEGRRISQAFERGFQSAVGARPEGGKKNSNNKKTVPSPKQNKYQFVGVVDPSGGGDSKNQVTWYARPKPHGSKWSVRVVQVDRAAVIRDMFVRGEVDVYATYKNRGPTTETVVSSDGTTTETVPGPAGVNAEYTIKERSWRNLWNFSPVSLLGDRSGMYWRQRRLRPGIYTDGRRVFETTYHYSEGRNGMRLIADDLRTFVKRYPSSKGDLNSTLTKIQSRGQPDLVLEY